MPMTMTQKILAKKARRETVSPGEYLECPLDLILTNDISGPLAIDPFLAAGFTRVFDKDKVVFVLDHNVPCKDIRSARQCAVCRDFAREQELTHFYDVGTMGVEHALLPELGLVAPGELVIGGDSHTCTYGALGALSTGVGSTDLAAGMATGSLWFMVPEAIRVTLNGKPGRFVGGKDVILHLIGMIGVEGARYASLEFTGDGVNALEMEDRFTICNMAVEAGAKNCIFPVDEKTIAYLSERVKRPFEAVEPDRDASYVREIKIDLSELEPTVALPHLPSNTRTLREAAGIPIQQVVIGSCTNGRLKDMRDAADVLRGRKVAPGVRCIIIPGSQEIYLAALQEGLIAEFIRSGAAVSTPTCGPCFGGHIGVMADGEWTVSTTNRNFVGRMGPVDSNIILASPSIAAASAVVGKLAGPDML